ncbi:MAG: tRNA (guanosine(46)-N7)-methyltransferase TrmB [Rhodospirillales bacterium]
MDNLLPRLRLALPDSGGHLDIEGVFPVPVKDVWLEVGFGAGEHLAQQAANHPQVGMIGCEPFINGVAGLLARIKKEGLANIRIFDDDARLIFDALPDGEIGKVFVLFADPWPKKRHHKRRFISAGTLDALARLMKSGAELRFASDHMEYVRWTLDCVLRHACFEWTAMSAKDWRRRPDGGFETRYEAKARANGASCVYLSFVRLPRV